jgi:hypothetical protein
MSSVSVDSPPAAPLLESDAKRGDFQMAPITRQLPGASGSTEHDDMGRCGCVHISPKVAAQMRGVLLAALRRAREEWRQLDEELVRTIMELDKVGRTYRAGDR